MFRILNSAHSCRIRVERFTAGPLRLLLACDGEQVFSAQVEAGYAHRGVARAMTEAGWKEAAGLAASLDPLAPLAGRLAYVRALERLQREEPPAPVLHLREAALALERARNHLWWLARFAAVLAAEQLASRARVLATEVTRLDASLWDHPAAEWIAPQAGAIPVRQESVPAIRELANQAEALRERIGGDRWLSLRTRGLGVLAAGDLKAAGVSGPVLWASERGAGEVRSRLDVRLRAAVRDLSDAADRLAGADQDSERPARWNVLAGEARVTVAGPRGRIQLDIASRGEEGPARVEWRGPSAALLSIVPEALAGAKLVDAEAILASLDLAMSEADG